MYNIIILDSLHFLKHLFIRFKPSKLLEIYNGKENMSQEKFDLEEALKKLNDNPTVQKRNGTIKKKNPVKIEPDYRYEACNDSFPCANCGKMILPEGAGTHHRNHCPHCLSSIHVDIEPGDRKSDCKGIMEAISIWVKDKGEWAIIHRCKKCGKINTNRIAADDNPLLLMSMAVRPLASPPFPLHLLESFIKK